MKERLTSCIDSLKCDRRIQEFDEAATKQAVVLRLLSELGWNTFDVDEVTPEYSVRSQRVDYSLRLEGGNKVFVEVKKISENLEEHQEQLLDYSFREGVKLSVLTNGLTWWFYLPLNEGNWEQRKFYSIDVLQQRSEDVAQRFVDFLSKDSVASGQAIKNAESVYSDMQKTQILKDTVPKAWDKIISEADELLVELLVETTERLCGHRPDPGMVERFLSSVKTQAPTSAVPKLPVGSAPESKRKGRRLAAERAEDYTKEPVSSFSFRGTVYKVRFWRDVLVTLCEVLASRHGADFDKVLAFSGRKRRHFSNSANDLLGPRKIPDTRIYVETNFGANRTVRQCEKILSLFGYAPGELRINPHGVE